MKSTEAVESLCRAGSGNAPLRSTASSSSRARTAWRRSVIAERLGVTPATLSFPPEGAGPRRARHARTASRFIYYSASFERMAALMTYLTENCCRGMPGECLAPMETALSRCGSPTGKKAAHEPEPASLPVAVIGAGPVGLAAAAELLARATAPSSSRRARRSPRTSKASAT